MFRTASSQLGLSYDFVDGFGDSLRSLFDFMQPVADFAEGAAKLVGMFA